MLNCPECNSKLSIDMDITGGCSCSHGEGYCYCDSLDVNISFRCNSSNTTKCRKVCIKPEGLRDRYGIESWIDSHISESDL